MDKERRFIHSLLRFLLHSFIRLVDKAKIIILTFATIKTELSFYPF